MSIWCANSFIRALESFSRKLAMFSEKAFLVCFFLAGKMKNPRVAVNPASKIPVKSAEAVVASRVIRVPKPMAPTSTAAEAATAIWASSAMLDASTSWSYSSTTRWAWRLMLLMIFWRSRLICWLFGSLKIRSWCLEARWLIFWVTICHCFRSSSTSHSIEPLTFSSMSLERFLTTFLLNSFLMRSLFSKSITRLMRKVLSKNSKPRFSNSKMELSISA